MVNTRKSSLRPLGKAAAAAAGAGSHFISSRTRSSKRGTKADAAGLEETAAARDLLILEKAVTSVFEK